MRFVSTARCYEINFALTFFVLFASPCHAAQTSLPAITIQQTRDVVQGQSGEFEIKTTSTEKVWPISLRLSCDLGTGRAAFEDGSLEQTLTGSGTVRVRGITSSDLLGALTLTAWSEGAQMPAATAFFDVLAANLEPRIFFNGFDVTGTHLSVVVGQQIQLTVFLHPGLAVQSQEWSIGISRRLQRRLPAHPSSRRPATSRARGINHDILLGHGRLRSQSCLSTAARERHHRVG